MFVGFVTLLALPGGASAAEPGLVGQWHFDTYSGSGSNANTPDSSGSGGTGSFAATPTLSAGRFASAFNGPVGAEPMTVTGTSGNGSWVLEPAVVSLTAWVKYSGDPGVLKYIAAKGDFRYVPGSDCAGSSYALYTGYNARPGLTFYVTTANGVTRASPNLTNTAAAFDGQWHSVTGTYDGSDARLYVDGALVSGAEAGTGSGAIKYGGSLQQHSGFGAGAYPDAGTCPDNTKFPGSIDEVRVHNRVLTPAEIVKLHDRNATTPPDLTPAGGGGGGHGGGGGGPPVAARNITPPVLLQKSISGGRHEYTCSDGTWEGVAAQPGFVHQIWEDTLFNGEKLVAGGGVIVSQTAKKRVFFCRVTATTSSGARITASGDGLLVPDSRIGAPLRRMSAGDLRIRGIDVFQVSQPSSGAGMFDYPGVGGFPDLCGGGTPTSLTQPDCKWLGKESQTARYRGVTLDAGKPTSAFVYVDHTAASVPDAGLRNLPLVVRLHGFAPGRLNATLTQTVTLGSRDFTPNDFVTDYARGTAGLRFVIPQTWLDAVAAGSNGAFDLDATVSIAEGHPEAEQCARVTVVETLPLTTCGDNDTYKVTGIPARHFTFQPVIRTVALLTPGQTLNSLNNPQSVLQRTRDLFPGGESFRVSDYVASIRIDPYKYTADSDNCPRRKDDKGDLILEDKAATAARVRQCRSDFVQSMMRAWVYSAPRPGDPLFKDRGYNILVGVHSYDGGDGQNEPGRTFAGGVSGMQTPGEQPWLHLDDGTRNWPLKSAAHEMGHAFGASHAGIHYGIGGDPSCGGDLNGEHGEPWPPADSGRLEGIAFDARNGNRAVDRNVPDASGRPLFDLMSYCADDSNSWLSPRNWNQFVQAMGRQEGNIPPLRATERAATVKDTAYVAGSLILATARIDHLEPAQKGRVVPAALPGSFVRVHAFDAGGRLLGDVGAHIDLSSDGGGGTFVAPLPARTKRVELIVKGQKVDERAAPATAPTVKLTAPAAKTHARKALDVRWRARGRDLTATIDFSPGGAKWQTVYFGPSTGHATLPAELLQASGKARVRVRVSDGFSAATATSPAFRVDGAPPTAEIVRPVAGERLEAGQRVILVGHATDDAGRELKGRALRWLAGRKRLGTGARLTARLPAGKMTLRLVATDARGRRTTAKRTVRSTPPPLTITRLRSGWVKANAPRAVMSIAASRAAVLRAGGRSFAVGPKARRLRVSLPGKAKTGIVLVPLRLTPRGGGSGIRATLVVLRG